MSKHQSYCVEWLKGRAVKRRGLAWLIAHPENSIIDAKIAFEILDDDARRNLNNRFDAWIDGDKPNKRWYHPWDEKGYENVWVFKYQEHRLFAFACHPDTEDRRFMMCILVAHTVKFEQKADQKLKQLMQELSEDPIILNAAENVEEDCSSIKIKGATK